MNNNEIIRDYGVKIGTNHGIYSLFSIVKLVIHEQAGYLIFNNNIVNNSRTEWSNL